MTLHAICFHTEGLHDDQVWRRVQVVLDLLDKKSVKVTFLVYPFRSMVAGKDITERVKELAERGHEIGQHTHFYAGQATDRPYKHNDLSDHNIRACLKRDFQWLKRCGIEPKGFCAGAWLITETVLETLAELGFTYDCSTRLPHMRQDFEMPHLWAESAQTRLIQGNPLILLPTSDNLTLFTYIHPQRRKQKAFINEIKYQLVYHHDYDLFNWKVWQGLLLGLKVAHETRTVRELAELCLNQPTISTFATALEAR